MDDARTDAMGLLRWGLRHYRALVVLCVLLGAVAAPLLVHQRETTLDASALVIAQRLDTDLAALPRYGEAVFDNGSVAQVIRGEFRRPGERRKVIPDMVSLVAEQDSIVFEVVGHDVDPERAADMANTAAATYVRELNAAGVGVGAFALQSPAEPPARPGNLLSTLTSVPVGAAAGAVLGLALVAGIVVARRPIIDGSDAEEATGVPSLGTVTMPRVRGQGFAPTGDFTGLIPVCRRLLGLTVPTVVMVSRPRDQRRRRQLSVALVKVLMRVDDIRFVAPPALRSAVVEGHAVPTSGEPGNAAPAPGAPRLTIVDSSLTLDLLQPPTSAATVLVVPEGIGLAALSAAVVEHLGGSAEARLVLVKRGRRRSRTRDVPAAGTNVASAPREPVTVTGSR